MNIIFQKPSREQGSVLLITLTIGVILLVVMASYLLLLTNQKGLVTRSQTWNGALTMAEAGIEEGLAQLNASGISFVSAYPTNFANNNWSISGNVYVSSDMPRGLLGGRYSAVISNNLPPSVYSTGYATNPIVGGTISRSVRITTALQPLIAYGFSSVGGMDFNGNGVISDSYNSHDTNFSTLGQYDPNKASTNGSIASENGLINLGNHTINGNEYLGPNATSSGNGTVTGQIYTDYNVEIPPVQLPAGASSWTTAPTTSLSTTNNKGKVSVNTVYDFTTSGNYILTSDAYPIYVEAGVNVNLNVTSTQFSPPDLEIHGGLNNSGTVRFFINGATSLGVIANSASDASGRPENLWFYGLSTLTSVTYGGNTDFTGVIYAPNADLTLNGGGNSINLSGSFTVKSLKDNGHYLIHYDESLRDSGPARGYVATSWVEY